MGWRVTLIGSGPKGDREVNGVQVLCIPTPRIYILRQLVFHAQVLAMVLKAWSTIDIILFHEMSGAWVLPLRALRWITGRARPALAMDTRTLFMTDRERASGRDRLRKWYLDLMTRAGNRWADGRLAITQRMAGAIGIPPATLWGTWPSGVDVDEFSEPARKRRWPSDGEPIRLIYIGTLNHERNLLAMCAAVEQANSEGMDFVFGMVGDGTLWEELRQRAESSGGKIEVMPRVSHRQIPVLLSEWHIGVLPFRDELKFRVSSPIKLFEYMASGLPILATEVVCHTDAVGAGDYVFWARGGGEADLLSALRHIWQGRGTLAELGNHASDAASAWSWQRSAQKLDQALRRGLPAECEGGGRCP